jgi:hypothetical protein
MNEQKIRQENKFGVLVSPRTFIFVLILIYLTSIPSVVAFSQDGDTDGVDPNPTVTDLLDQLANRKDADASIDGDFFQITIGENNYSVKGKPSDIAQLLPGSLDLLVSTHQDSSIAVDTLQRVSPIDDEGMSNQSEVLDIRSLIDLAENMEMHFFVFTNFEVIGKSLIASEVKLEMFPNDDEWDFSRYIFYVIFEIDDQSITPITMTQVENGEGGGHGGRRPIFLNEYLYVFVNPPPSSFSTPALPFSALVPSISNPNLSARSQLGNQSSIHYDNLSVIHLPDMSSEASDVFHLLLNQENGFIGKSIVLNDSQMILVEQNAFDVGDLASTTLSLVNDGEVVTSHTTHGSAEMVLHQEVDGGVSVVFDDGTDVQIFAE